MPFLCIWNIRNFLNNLLLLILYQEHRCQNRTECESEISVLIWAACWQRIFFQVSRHKISLPITYCIMPPHNGSTLAVRPRSIDTYLNKRLDTLDPVLTHIRRVIKCLLQIGSGLIFLQCITFVRHTKRQQCHRLEIRLGKKIWIPSLLACLLCVRWATFSKWPQMLTAKDATQLHHACQRLLINYSYLSLVGLNWICVCPCYWKLYLKVFISLGVWQFPSITSGHLHRILREDVEVVLWYIFSQTLAACLLSLL